MYIDEILIVTKGTKQEHLEKVREVMKILDEANLVNGREMRNCAGMH